MIICKHICTFFYISKQKIYLVCFYSWVLTPTLFSLVSNLFFRPIFARIFWKFKCLVLEDSYDTGVWKNCFVCQKKGLDTKMLRGHFVRFFTIKTQWALAALTLFRILILCINRKMYPIYYIITILKTNRSKYW